MQKDLETLKAWQSAMSLAKAVYKETESFPQKEQYGLASQMRRAAVSIAANIAEGKGRNHRKEYLQFCYLARGSAYELITLIKLSEELGYLKTDQAQPLLSHSSETIAILTGLIHSLT